MKSSTRSYCGRLCVVGFSFVLMMLIGSNAYGYELKHDRHGNVLRWETDRIDLCLGTELLDRFGFEYALGAAEAAADAWSGIPGAPTIVISVEQTRGFDSARVSDCVHMARPWVGEGNELALTFTAADDEGVVRSAEIVLNHRHRYGIPSAPFGAESYDLQAVLTHEMGHLLGLSENYDDPESTMRPDIGPGDTFQRDITDDDRAGVEHIYASAPEPRGVTCAVDRRGGGDSFAFLAFLFATGLAFRRRGRIVHSCGQ